MLLLALVLLGALGSAVAQDGAACVLQLSTGALAFDHCQLLEGIGSNFNIMWNVSANEELITWGMNATTDGYVGLGFPLADSDNVMVGTNAFLLQSCDGCLSGAQIRQVYMSGTTSGDMHPSNGLNASELTAQSGPGDWLVGTFVMQALPDIPIDEYIIISAAGGVYRNGDIRLHSTYGTATLNLTSGELDEPETFSKPVSALVAAHIWLLIIGWGFFAPLGVLFARSLKHLDPTWFQLHRALMVLGLLMGIAGLALGFAISGGWTGAFPVHRNLGLASIIMGIAQSTALVFRPTLSSKYRRTWNIGHWWNGRASILCGVANVYYGLTQIVDTGSYGWGIYTAVFACIVAAGISKESWDYVQLPPPAVEKHMKYDGSKPALFAPNGGDANLEMAPRGDSV